MAQDSDIVEQAESVNGVRYATIHGSEFRVVFDHKAPATALAEVSEITGQDGYLVATQEHLPAVEFAAGTTSEHANES